MIQSVNLYTEELRPSKERLQAKSAALALALALLVVVVAGGVARYQAVQAEQNLAIQEQRNEQLLATVERLSAAVAEQQPDAALEAELETIRQTVARREYLLDRVTSLVSDDSDGFSPLLEGLARRVPDGLWLTGIRMQPASGVLVLEGQTEAGSLVPVFLDQLGNEPAFSGMAFGAFRLLREEDSRWIGFRVATRRNPEGAE